MIIDGRKIAESVYASLEAPRPLTLGILVGGTNPVIDSFVRIKAKVAERLGVMLVREELQTDATTADAIAVLTALADKTDGVVVQLPLPKEISVEDVLGAIPSIKDVDGISAAPIVRPPVAEAIAEILKQIDFDVHRKSAVVIGSGRLVGLPAAALLTALGADVHVITLGDSLMALQSADIVISGAGQPNLITPEHLKKGVVLIDAGTSDLPAQAGIGRRIAGDADPACAEIASVFTPVPGGVGPIAVAMIFKNLFTLANKSSGL